jgi:Zn-dependent protease/CBS domain-containing protein
MFGKGFHLFTLLGFRVSIDPSWFLLAVLIVWSLARGYFPTVVEDLAPTTAVWLALLGALGLFASIIFHEFAHALVARRFDMPIAGITLFLFGGVAQLRGEPPSAKAEFLVAIAGPISSYLLAAVLYVLLLPFGAEDRLGPVAAVLAYLMTINVLLATFNLLPAFPLDGGRVLRAAVWGWTGSLRRATQVSAGLGRGLGAALMLLGVLNIVAGQFIGGMWIGLIGFFIIGAAGASEMQVEMKLGLEGVSVRDIMNPKVIAAPADITVAELVDGYFYRHFHKSFPVIWGDQLVGCVRLQDVGRVAREDWSETKVAEILTDENATHVVEPGAPVWEALGRMNEKNVSRLMVVERGELRGMLTMRDLMRFLSIRRELEGEAGGRLAARGIAREGS